MKARVSEETERGATAVEQTRRKRPMRNLKEAGVKFAT